MKYDVIFSCGHKGEVELLGKHADRERKIKFFEESGLCEECYKKKMDKEAEKQKFTLNISILPDIDEEDGEMLLCVWFSGNTKPHKDAIKALGGYRWEERTSAADFYTIQRTPMCWEKVVRKSQLQKEIDKAKSIGVEAFHVEKGIAASAHYKIAVEKCNKWLDKKKRLDSLVKPAIPELVKNRKWNGKVYGTKTRSIYLDGEKIEINLEQAEELEKYSIAFDEYWEKREEIRKE